MSELSGPAPPEGRPAPGWERGVWRRIARRRRLRRLLSAAVVLGTLSTAGLVARTRCHPKLCAPRASRAARTGILRAAWHGSVDPAPDAPPPLCELAR